MIRPALLVLGLAALLCSPSAAQDAWPRTAPERTDHRETTRHADALRFMETIAARSPIVQLDTFGYSMEGRPLVLAVVSARQEFTPAQVRGSGKTVIYVQGNIHAGEVEGKESALMLLRELAQGQHAALLDSLILLIAPIYNADGNERVLLTNRPLQHGPVGGMGQRPNAQGLDLNRDHMKLETPEARSLVRMLNRYDPHVGIDLHTTNGTRHAYHLTYSPPLHPNTDSSLIRVLRNDWFPEITRQVRAKHGWHYYYYGNVGGEGEDRGWYTFDHRPRFNNNYLGLRNRFALLSEAYSYATFPDRILATTRFLAEALAFAHAHASELRATVAAADAAPMIGQQLAVRATFERAAQPVEILMGAVVEERHPLTGAVMLRRTDVVTPTRMNEYGTFRGTVFERVPSAYVVPAEEREVIDLLRAHGVLLDTVAAARTVDGERFRIENTSVAEREFQGHRERTVEGGWERARLDLSPGDVIVRVDQPLGRIVFMLLEPRSDESVTTWNFLDERIEEGRFPVERMGGG